MHLRPQEAERGSLDRSGIGCSLVHYANDEKPIGQRSVRKSEFLRCMHTIRPRSPLGGTSPVTVIFPLCVHNLMVFTLKAYLSGITMISEALPGGPVQRIKHNLQHTGRSPAWMKGGKRLLWWGVLDELDALLNVALQALDARLQERLLLVGHTVQDVDGLLGAVGLSVMSVSRLPNTRSNKETYAQFHGGREELHTGRLGDLVAAGHTGQVDESRFDDALLAPGGLDHGLGEADCNGQWLATQPRGGQGTNRKPARAMERVAEPAPSLALTTSSPPNWTPASGQSLERLSKS